MVKTTIGMCALILAATFTLSSCSSNGDTVVAVNYALDDSAKDVKDNVATISVKVGSAETEFVITRNDKNEITSSPNWKRVVVNGMSGTVKVTGTAKDKSGTTLLEISQDVVLVQHGAIEAFLNFSRSKPEPPVATGGSPGAGGTGAGGTGAGGTSAAGSGTGGTGGGSSAPAADAGTGAGGAGAGGTSGGTT
jgi:hypothetical protein